MQNFNIFPDTRLDALESCFFRTKNPFECQRDLGSSQKPKRSQRQILFYFFLNIIKVISCVFIAPKIFPELQFFLPSFIHKAAAPAIHKTLVRVVLLLNQPARKFHLNFFMLSLLLCTLRKYLIAAMYECCLS